MYPNSQTLQKEKTENKCDQNKYCGLVETSWGCVHSEMKLLRTDFERTDIDPKA